VTPPPAERDPLLPKLLLALASSVLFLGALEGLCRLTEPPRRAVASYIVNWQQWGDDFYTVSSQSSGWPPWEEFNVDGVRDRTHPTEKAAGVYRIAVLGDSVTLGAGIRADEAFPQVLEARLRAEGRPVEVFNIALWGWSTRQEAIAYERIARTYKPDAVVLAVCLNDIPELQNNLSAPPAALGALYKASALVRLAVGAERREIRSVEDLFRDTPAVSEAFARFFQEVRTLDHEVKADGATLTVLVAPFRFQVGPKPPAPSAQERIRAFCQAAGIPFLDALPTLRPLGPSAFVDYDHLSPSGAAATASLLAKELSLPPGYGALLGERGLSEAGLGLQDPDPRVRAASVWALSRQDPSPVRDAAFGEALVRDGDPLVRALAAEALGQKGRTSGREAVLRALSDPSETVRWSAAHAAFSRGLEAPRDLPELVHALESPDPFVRGFASFSLGTFGPAAAEAAPALVRALAQDRAYGRGGAAAALARIGSAAAEAVPALLEALRSGDPISRARAARTLGRIGPASHLAIPVLIERLSDPDEVVRAQAARALGRIAPRDDRVRTALSRSVQDGERSVAKEAENALAR
jgi:HEAT repeat protein/lysophospholipase L1-like esterase